MPVWRGLDKQSCQFVCGRDMDGKDVLTMDDQPFLAVNGIQTMGYTYTNLIQEMEEMEEMGISRFRLWPHSQKMDEIITLFSAVLKKEKAPSEALKQLSESVGYPFSNGFYYGQPGVDYVADTPNKASAFSP